MKVRAFETVAKWRLNAADQVAPLRRQSCGAITATIWWRLNADNEMAP